MLALVAALTFHLTVICAGLARMSRGGAAGRTRGHWPAGCERAEKISARVVEVRNLS